LSLGLQYSDTAGITQLRDWLYGLQQFSHGRKKGDGYGVMIGTGSQDLIFKVSVLLLFSIPG
jgi:tryptophan aminotransferase